MWKDAPGEPSLLFWTFFLRGGAQMLTIGEAGEQHGLQSEVMWKQVLGVRGASRVCVAIMHQ